MPRCIEKMSAFQAKALFYYLRLKHSPAYNMYEQLVPEERMYYFFQQRKIRKNYYLNLLVNVCIQYDIQIIFLCNKYNSYYKIDFLTSTKIYPNDMK